MITCINYSIIFPLASVSTNQAWYGIHYCDVIMNTIASQITSLTIVYLTVNSGTDQRKHQSSASLAFVRGIHRRPVNSPHKGPVTRKMFPFDDVIMITCPQLLIVSGDYIGLVNHIISPTNPALHKNVMPWEWFSVFRMNNLEVGGLTEKTFAFMQFH